MPSKTCFKPKLLACISHHLAVEACDRPVITSLRLPAVLTVLFQYASLLIVRNGAPGGSIANKSTHPEVFLDWGPLISSAPAASIRKTDRA